jgi:hypothetical protein
VSPNVAGAYVREAACCRAGSDSTPLHVGGRKSREADLQPKDGESMAAWPFTTPKSQCHTQGGQPTASWTSTWQVRTCGKQPVVGQKATPLRSAPTKGRVAKPQTTTARQTDEGAALRRDSEARTGHLDHFGSSHTTKAVGCGGHVTIA